MKIEDIDVTQTIANAKELLAAEKKISPALKLVIGLLITIVELLISRLSTNSRNSSKPPSTDPNRPKKKKVESNKKQGGQNGHIGTNLTPAAKPDKVITLKYQRSSLPKGEYQEKGYETRQVVNIHIKKVVTEYRAQILQDQNGKLYTAAFPAGVTQRVQYGQDIKATSVYMSAYQLIPYGRTASYFAQQLNVPLSVGTVFNFNKEAYRKLEEFEEIAKGMLINSATIHADETGINVGGKRIWLHNASNDLWTYFYPHKVRGSEAMDEIGILPHFKGVLCHDHWKPYYRYQDCQHSLCNAHHLRELEKIVQDHKHQWAKEMQDLLLRINKAVLANEGSLKPEEAEKYRLRYRIILALGDLESPPPEPSGILKNGQPRKRVKKAKHRNLLERLRNFEDDVLRFMENKAASFTNNQGENDIRMTKVQQKISGCFRSIEGAKIFCRVRSYLLTAQKHNLDPSQALTLLFNGSLPDFCR